MSRATRRNSRVGALDVATLTSVTHNARFADVRRGKGGVIGTNGKGVIAWRVDHQLDEFRATTWPILRDRGMPCGVGIVPLAVGNAAYVPDPTATTWTQAKTMHWEGAEAWAHSTTHLDPSPAGTGQSIYEEIVTCRATMEANGLTPVGWQMPGISGAQTPNYSSNFNTVEQFGTDVGQLFMATYGLIELDRGAQGARRVLPTDGCYGLGHSTLDSLTLVQAKAQVDVAINYGMGVELMHHPRYIGGTGFMSVSDFTALADYVLAAWDAGTIEVLTPSGLAFADPGQTRRLNLIRHGDFEGISLVGTTLGSWALNNATGISLQTSGGHGGSNFLRFTAAAGANYAFNSYTFPAEGNLQSQAFLTEAWVRNTGASGSTARIYIIDNSGSNPTFIRDIRLNLTAGQGWTRMRVPFCIPQTCTNVLMRLSSFTGGDVDFDDVRMVAV